MVCVWVDWQASEFYDPLDHQWLILYVTDYIVEGFSCAYSDVIPAPCMFKRQSLIMFDQLGLQNWNDLLCILLILSIVLTRGRVGGCLVPCENMWLWALAMAALLSPPADIFKMCYSCTMTRVRIAIATGALMTIPRTITCLTGYHVPFNLSFTLLYMSPELCL